MDYDHTQRAPLHWFLVVPGTAMLVTAWQAEQPDWSLWLLSTVGAIMIGLSLCFRRLRLHDDGDALGIVFGPVELFRNRLRYDQITGFRAARSALIDGWGIHRLPGRGWIWNLWGFDCVAFDLKDGTTLRLGTDDVPGLLAHLEARTGLATEGSATEGSAVEGADRGAREENA